MGSVKPTTIKAKSDFYCPSGEWILGRGHKYIKPSNLSERCVIRGKPSLCPGKISMEMDSSGRIRILEVRDRYYSPFDPISRLIAKGFKTLGIPEYDSSGYEAILEPPKKEDEPWIYKDRLCEFNKGKLVSYVHSKEWSVQRVYKREPLWQRPFRFKFAVDKIDALICDGFFGPTQMLGALKILDKLRSF